MGPGAFVLLGWSACKALVKRPFKAKGAERRVRNRLRPYGIEPFSAEESALRRAAGACFSCGRCDVVWAAAGGGGSPADWVGAELRDPTAGPVAAPHGGTDAAWTALRDACPAGVPFDRLAGEGRAGG